LKDKKWFKRNIRSEKGRVFVQQVPDSDAPLTEDWERAHYEKYRKENFGCPDRKKLRRQMEKDLINKGIKK